ATSALIVRRNSVESISNAAEPASCHPCTSRRSAPTAAPATIATRNVCVVVRSLVTVVLPVRHKGLMADEKEGTRRVLMNLGSDQNTHPHGESGHRPAGYRARDRRDSTSTRATAQRERCKALLRPPPPSR